MSVAEAIEGVAEVYPGPPAPVHALEPLDLPIAPGAFVALLGPSGCGKSTLLSLMAGLEPASRGRVAIDAREVRGPQTAIGIVFQSPVVVDWRDVLDNVLLRADLHGLDRRALEPRARELLRSMGLEAFLDRRPRELSGGVQQRTAFCCALVHDPPLVLMDEPLGALDAMTREQLRADLERIWMRTGKTVILVTHAIDEAVQLADRVIVVSPRPGRIVRDLSVVLPRPRTLEVCESPPFHAWVAEIERIFRGYGVL